MNIKVKEINKKDWDISWSQIYKSSLPQSWEYGEAVKKNKNIKVKRIVFINNSNSPVAIAQVLIKEFYLFKFYLGSIVKINRGPLLINQSFEHSNYSKNYKFVLDALKEYSRKSKWWLYFLTLELDQNDKNYLLIKNLGLRVNKKKYWGSSTISLFDHQDLIIKKFKQRWRRCFKKSLNQNIIIDEIRDSFKAENLICKYNTMLQKENNFKGLTNKFLISLIRESIKNSNINLFVAYKLTDKKDIKIPLGILLSVDHGSTTSYLMGYLNKYGREINANYQLFWHAIIYAKENGKKFFDLGGITENTTKGILQFKRGFNGEQYNLVGDAWGFSII